MRYDIQPLSQDAAETLHIQIDACKVSLTQTRHAILDSIVELARTGNQELVNDAVLLAIACDHLQEQADAWREVLRAQPTTD